LLRSWKRLRRRLRVRVGRSDFPEHSLEIMLGAVVGVLGGLAAVGFRWLLGATEMLFFDGLGGLLAPIAPYHLLVLPALGGLIVGPFVWALARGVEGSGVPELQEAAARRGGRLRSACWVYKAIASAITIGSGGSAGREGPIAFIGSSLAADLGRLVRGGERRRRALLASGAAAGVAATFNAPLAGTFFALEIVLGTWAAEAFAPVIVAAVVGSAIGRHFFGSHPAFFVHQYSLATFAELPIFALLGAAAAVVGVLFIAALYGVGDLWNRARMPIPLRLAPAGVAVGALGLLHPGVIGLGYDTIEDTLLGHLADGRLLLLLMLGKLIATSLTLGSRGSGGIFAPALFIGAMLGGAVGQFWSQHVAAATSPGAYALVGMGALFAAVSHAPMTAVLTIFEITGDYRMILPLMLACGIASIVAQNISRVSIYNLKLLRRGVHIQLGHDVVLLNDIEIRQAMTTDLVTVLPQTAAREVLKLSEHTTHHGFPLADEQGRLHGLITCEDVRRAAEEGRLEEPVSNLAAHRLIVAFPDETLNDALRKLGLHHVGRVPVVSREDHRELLGIITRKDIISAYNRALVQTHTDLGKTAETELFE
jgi:CIC family chloride channel protein